MFNLFKFDVDKVRPNWLLVVGLTIIGLIGLTIFVLFILKECGYVR